MGRLNKTSSGESIYRCRESGKELAAYKTLRCRHCGFHWDVVPGSGRYRGWCMLCNGPTCGKPECDVCIPSEQKLENAEAGRDEFFRPIRISVPVGFDLIIPESCCASIAAPFDVPDGATGGLDMVPSSDPQRGDSISGVRPEALDSTPAGSADVPILLDAGTESLGQESMGTRSVGG